MKKILLKEKNKDCQIVVGESFKNVLKYTQDNECVIISDQKVSELYQAKFPAKKLITVKSSENNKNLKTINNIYQKLFEMDVDRSTFILGIGGGIITDITGFVASTYLRGLRFGFVPTTLLSQVDASVGGKNGVNYDSYKNMVGTINQPEFVLCDVEFLLTLPENEFLNGLAEIIKHALIADKKLFQYLEANIDKVLSLNKDVLELLIYKNLKIKTKIVHMDEKENGMRKKLNFGHTFGHALEKLTAIKHGKAVSIGMVLAARLSEKKGNIKDFHLERIVNLIQKAKLPTKNPSTIKNLLHAVKKDKKRNGTNIDFIFLKDFGEAVIEKISFAELENLLRAID